MQHCKKVGRRPSLGPRYSAPAATESELPSKGREERAVLSVLTTATGKEKSSLGKGRCLLEKGDHRWETKSTFGQHHTLTAADHSRAPSINCTSDSNFSPDGHRSGCRGLLCEKRP